jgi:hypothetical protein
MSGSSRGGFTWKEVADILRICEVSNAAIFQREIKPPRKGRIRAGRASDGTNDAQRTSNQAPLRRPGASR